MAGCFQPREEGRLLEEAGRQSGTGGLCHVLVGLGGIGKTQVAAQYADAMWQQGGIDLLIWITAATRDAVETAYLDAAQDILGMQRDDPRAVERLLGWLAATNRRWLVVLDDLATPESSTVGPAATELMNGLWPPESSHGRTLVTTRLREAALTNSRSLVEVGAFTPAQARAYLIEALGAHARHDPGPDLDALAEDLGRLPLALAQAAAYLVDTHIPAAAYRNLLADRAIAELAPDALPDDQTRTVAATWQLSIERADHHTAGLARPLLQLAAFLDPAGIPNRVLTTRTARTHLAAHRARRSPQSSLRFRRPLARLRRKREAAVDSEHVYQTLRILHRLGLATHVPDTPHQALRIHQLVQRTTHDTLAPADRGQIARIGADALLEAWPEIERDTSLMQALRANTTILTRRIGRALYQPHAHFVLSRAGESLGRGGQPHAAAEYFMHLADTCREYLGPSHPDTLVARHNLAHWRAKSGDAAGAVEALEALLEDKVRVLGPDHRDTLATRHSLARWRGRTGDAAGAVEALEALLEDKVRVLGPDHRDTLATRHNLAHWRGRTGDAAGAVEALKELLVDELRLLGPDHPDALATRHGLAHGRGMTGDAIGAVEALEELLEDKVRVLGPDHPHTLAARHDLAHWRGVAGDAAGAAKALKDLLEDMLRVLSPENPHALAARHALTYWRGEGPSSES